MFYVTDEKGIAQLARFHVSVHPVSNGQFLVLPVFLDQGNGSDGSGEFRRYCEKFDEVLFQTPYGDNVRLAIHERHDFLLMFLNDVRVVCSYYYCELANKIEYVTSTKAALFYREQWGAFDKSDLPAQFQSAPIAQWDDRGVIRCLSVARAKPEELLAWRKKGWKMVPSYTISTWNGVYEFAPLTGTDYFPVRVKGAYGDKERFQTYLEFVAFVGAVTK